MFLYFILLIQGFVSVLNPKEGDLMNNNVRCQCGKILCQVYENMVIIKCRHCKVFLMIRFNGVQKATTNFEYDYLTKLKY